MGEWELNIIKEEENGFLAGRVSNARVWTCKDPHMFVPSWCTGQNDADIKEKLPRVLLSHLPSSPSTGGPVQKEPFQIVVQPLPNLRRTKEQPGVRD